MAGGPLKQHLTKEHRISHQTVDDGRVVHFGHGAVHGPKALGQGPPKYDRRPSRTLLLLQGVRL